jgi:hypothetical protein
MIKFLWGVIRHPIDSFGQLFPAPPKGHHPEQFDLRYQLNIAQAEVRRWEARHKDLKEMYNDLLMQVSCKFPGETRHETAKRYIMEHEKFLTPEAGAKKTEEAE